MAITGVSTFIHAPLEEKTNRYGTPEKMAGAVDFKETLDRNDAKLYADNELKDSDTSVTGGKLALTIDNDDDTIFAPILGETVEKAQIKGKEYNVVCSRTSDIPAYQGFGYIATKNGGKYKAIFYPKVTFVRNDEEAKTMEDKTEYTKPGVEGTIYPVDGTYKETVTVDTLEEAKAALYYFLGSTGDMEDTTKENEGVTE